MLLKNGTETSARNKDFINKTGSESIKASLTIPQNQREEEQQQAIPQSRACCAKAALPSPPTSHPSWHLMSDRAKLPSFPSSPELLLQNQVPGNLSGLTPPLKM